MVIDVEPFVEFEADQTWSPVCKGIETWILAYNAAGKKIPELLKSLEKFPDRANDIAAAA